MHRRRDCARNCIRMVDIVDKPLAAVLVGFGINCEAETAHALSLGGSECEFVHFNQFLNQEKKLESYQILALPGGFSFGDDIASGRVLANKFRYKLSAPLKQFIDAGKPVVGICNGFQVLVQLGILPGIGDWSDRPATLMRNASGKFEDRWVRMRTESSVCNFAQGMDFITAPVRHGEGLFAVRDRKTLDAMRENRQVVFRYAGPDGMAATEYPHNPNGSCDAIAGICNPAGNVLGLMPHPECHVRYLQSPHWSKNPAKKPERENLSFLDKISGALMPPPSPEDAGNSLRFFEGIADAAKKYI